MSEQREQRHPVPRPPRVGGISGHDCPDPSRIPWGSLSTGLALPRLRIAGLSPQSDPSVAMVH